MSHTVLTNTYLPPSPFPQRAAERDDQIAPFIFPAELFAPLLTPSSAPGSVPRAASPSAARTPRSTPSAAGLPRRWDTQPFEAGHSPEGLELDRATPRLPCDVVETPCAFFLRFDCAGAEREAVSLDIGARTRDLRVTVHRLRGKAALEEEKARGNSVISVERPMGSSARRIVLPPAADLEAVETAFIGERARARAAHAQRTRSARAHARART